MPDSLRSSASFDVWDRKEGTPGPMGVTWLPALQAWNFALYSRRATGVTLLLYGGDDAVRPILELRLDPRIKARLADYLPMGKSIPINALVGVKDEMIQEAQTALMASYSKWKKAGDYEVQVVATGFHLTDLSSGTPAVATRSWW